MSELKAMTVLNIQQMGCYDNALVYFKTEADKEISDLKRLNHDLCERVTENDEIRQHWEEIEQTTAENAMLKAKLADKDAEIAQLQAMLEERNKQVGELKDEIRNLKRSLIVARHEVAKARGKNFSNKYRENIAKLKVY